MVHKVEQNTDWKSRYLDALKDLEQREQGWAQSEELLRQEKRELEKLIHKVSQQLEAPRSFVE